MTIPEKSWIKYINMLSAVSKTAARKFSAYLNDPGHDISSKAGRKAAIDYAAALADAYGESAAAVACQMYDAVAEASKVTLPPAVPAPTPEYGEVAKAVNGMLKHNQGSDAIGASIGRLVKRTGVDTTLQNALRDGAEFAWVPHGDTCSFCIMLASNGWQKASKKTVKGDHAEHVHANCDCTFAIRFDGKSGVKGYDPDKYREIYDNAEGSTWQEKLNSMRRDEYAANADKINAMKRELYAEKNGLNGENANGILKAAERSRTKPGSDEKAIISDIVFQREYREKMQFVGENDNITDIMTYQARTTLYRRNGTPFEDMIYINPNTGEVLVQRGMDKAGEVKPTKKMKQLVLQNPQEIIGMHNHPHSNLPSYDDLASAKQYRYGLTLCHDGKIVKYTVAKDADLFTVDAMLDLIQVHLSEYRDISGELSLLKDLGVEMEVF